MAGLHNGCERTPRRNKLATKCCNFSSAKIRIKSDRDFRFEILYCMDIKII